MTGAGGEGVPSDSMGSGARRDAFACLLITALTLVVFWPVFGFGFVDFDDGTYVFENTRVVRGLDAAWPVAYVVGVNGATFVLYGYDKLAARWDMLRVPEKVLHCFAFIGGTPLAYVAQRFFRHKTRKGEFRLVFRLLAVLQLIVIGALVWYFYGR